MFNKGSANIDPKISIVIKTKYVIEVILSSGLEPIFLNIILIYTWLQFESKIYLFSYFFSSAGISMNNKLWFTIFVHFCILQIQGTCKSLPYFFKNNLSFSIQTY